MDWKAEGFPPKSQKNASDVMMKPASHKRAALVWFRRDLRLADHAALTAAIEAGLPIVPVYILDDHTPGEWRMGGASRWWLAQSLRSLEKSLQRFGSRLILRRGQTERVLHELITETGATAIYFTRGYEPFQRSLVERLKWALGRSVQLRRFGGQVLFEPEKIANATGEPFRVYSPFYRALTRREAPSRPLPAPLALPSPSTWPRSEDLDDLGLEPTKPDWAGGFRAAWTPSEIAAYARLRLFIDRAVSKYRDQRNNPGSDSTSRLSPYLAFGEISPRQVWHAVLTAAEAVGQSNMGEAYLREIAWREFSYHLLFHFPDLPEKAFRPEFENFPFREDKHALSAWQRGQTGYPIVDAGMRQLWQTGWMHNRVRMIVASFLIKHLLQPWQSGEAWFWDTLVDADLANNGSGSQALAQMRPLISASSTPSCRAKSSILRAITCAPSARSWRSCPTPLSTSRGRENRTSWHVAK